jgi:hypothetical protein
VEEAPSDLKVSDAESMLKQLDDKTSESRFWWEVRTSCRPISGFVTSPPLAND